MSHQGVKYSSVVECQCGMLETLGLNPSTHTRERERDKEVGGERKKTRNQTTPRWPHLAQVSISVSVSRPSQAPHTRVGALTLSCKLSHALAQLCSDKAALKARPVLRPGSGSWVLAGARTHACLTPASHLPRVPCSRGGEFIPACGRICASRARAHEAPSKRRGSAAYLGPKWAQIDHPSLGTGQQGVREPHRPREGRKQGPQRSSVTPSCVVPARREAAS